MSGSAWFAAAVIFALAVRLYLLWQYYCISSDGVVYLRAAADFYKGDLWGGLSSVYPPGYPLIVATVYPLVGDWERAGQLVSLVFGIAILFPLFWIFSSVFNEKIALLASFLLGISPYLALYSVHVRSESCYFFLSGLVLFLVLSGSWNHRLWRLFGAGLAAGYAYLIRPEAMAFLVLVPLYFIFLWMTDRCFAWRQMIKSISVLCLGFVLCALPYVAYLSIDTGRLGAISRKAGVTLEINLREAGYLTTDGNDVGSLVFTDYLKRHPLEYLQKIISDLPNATWVFLEALHFSFVPFLAMGLYVLFREKFWRRADLPLLGFVLFFIYGFALFYVKRRYALQAVPIALGWVALGISWFWDWLREKLSAKQATMVGLFVGVVFLCGTLPKTLKPVSLEKSYVREAGLYLRKFNETGDLRVAVLDDRVTFYAGAKTVLLNDADASSMASQLHEQRAEYLVGEKKALNRFSADLTAHPEKAGLVLEKTFVGTRKDQMLVYRVL